jgi:tRNA G10  N-methylase Trm11
MSDKFIFLLGNTPDLSLQELQKILPEASFESLSFNLVRTTLTEKDFTPAQLIEILGGTVKIFQEIKPLAEHTPVEDIKTEIIEFIRSEQLREFAVAELGRDHLEVIEAAEIKAILKKRDGIATRYIEGSRYGLSSAVLSHQKVTEIAVIQGQSALVLAKTVGVQDIDQWTLRDRMKPYADRKKGMLPPKVARMMVNLAVGPNPAKDDVLLDPFCGTGTILLEGLERQINVIGNDLDIESTVGARTNVEWYRDQIIETLGEATVYNQDATKLLLPQSQKVQYLVTEPFLGKPRPQPDQLENIFRGIERLYLGAFKQWRNILAPGARLVCVFPAVLSEHTPGYPTVTLKALIDKLAQFGYTTTSESVVYHRPQAVISRQIYQFEYKPE